MHPILKKNNEIYSACKESSLHGKWISFSDIEPILTALPKQIQRTVVGYSEKETPISTLTLGSGVHKILIWTQMHGNESTGTKAVFDLLNYLGKPNDKEVVALLSSCTLVFIPMLNPDGALLYTRENALGIDLNRDALALKAKESVVLRAVLEEFRPAYCFNLHDQRTIFGVAGSRNPAALSFLAPSEDEERTITEGRKETMRVVVAMNTLLQQVIPGRIGRYTDEFYPTATGDVFQRLGYNTILIEAGHFPGDYDREKVREFNFYALLEGVKGVVSKKKQPYEPYFDIPNNTEVFFDRITRDEHSGMDTAYQYRDFIEDGVLVVKLEKVRQGDLSDFIGHNEDEVS